MCAPCSCILNKFEVRIVFLFGSYHGSRHISCLTIMRHCDLELWPCHLKIASVISAPRFFSDLFFLSYEPKMAVSGGGGYVDLLTLTFCVLTGISWSQYFYEVEDSIKTTLLHFLSEHYVAMWPWPLTFWRWNRFASRMWQLGNLHIKLKLCVQPFVFEQVAGKRTVDRQAMLSILSNSVRITSILICLAL